MKQGFSTLEAMIAIAVLALGVSAAVLVSFGNQNFVIDTDTSSLALYRAKAMIEDARAAAQDVFSAVTASSTSGSYFTDTLTVLDISPCLKHVFASTTWQIDARHLGVEISSILTSPEELLKLGGDCDATPPGDWDNPVTADTAKIGGQGVTDLDAKDHFIYLSSDPSAAAARDFFIYQFNPATLKLTKRSELDLGEGTMRINVAVNASAGKLFAYLLNASTTQQLLVIDVTDPANPALRTTVDLPDATNAIGRSIYFYDNRIYIGTQYLPCPPTCAPTQNHEFHIFDVSSSTNPIWLGSLDVDHNVNDIFVRDHFAYLATSDDTGELMVVDISNPAAMQHPDVTGMKYNTPSNTQDATALYVSGTRAYLGLRRDGTGNALHDLFALNISTPNAIALFGSRDLGLSNTSEVVGVHVTGNLGFLGLDQPTFAFKIIHVNDPLLPDHVICTSPNFSENTTAIDMDHGFLFTGNRSQDELRVIRDQPSSC